MSSIVLTPSVPIPLRAFVVAAFMGCHISATAAAQSAFLPQSPVLQGLHSRIGFVGSLAIRDMDSDGIDDVVALYADNTAGDNVHVGVFYGPSFPAWCALPTDATPIGTTSTQDAIRLVGQDLAKANYTTTNTESVLLLGRCFAGAQGPDVIVPVHGGSTDCELWVCKNPGSSRAPAWQSQATRQTNLTLVEVRDMVLRDMDADGLDDLVVLHGHRSSSVRSAIRIFWNRSATVGVTPSTVFDNSDATAYSLPFTSSLPAPMVIDVWQHGGVSLIVYGCTAGVNPAFVEVVRPTGRTAPNPQLTLVRSLSVGRRPVAIKMADFSGDGVDEIVIGCKDTASTSNIVVQRMNAVGTTQGQPLYFGGLDVVDLDATDINGDSRLDLLVVAENDANSADLVGFECLPVPGVQGSLYFPGTPIQFSSGVRASGVEIVEVGYSVAVGRLFGMAVDSIAMGGDPMDATAFAAAVLMRNNVQSTWGLSGAACGGSLSPAIALRAGAYLGQNYEIDIASGLTSSAFTMVTLGFSDSIASSLGGAQLPLALDSVGMTGCVLFCDPQALFFLGSSASSQVTFSLPVPNSAVLRNVTFFQQACIHAPGVNAASLLTSRLCRARIL